LSFVVYDTDQAAEWDGCVTICSHDFYHLSSYHRLAEHRGEGEARLLVYRENEEHVALPILVKRVSSVGGLESSSRVDVTSVYGYSGPVAVPGGVSPECAERFQAAVRNYFAEIEVCCAFARLHPLLDQTGLLDGLGELRRSGTTISIDLGLPLDEQWSGFRKGHKYDIKKLRRESYSCIHDTELVHLDAFADLYSGTMERLGAAASLRFDREYFRSLFGLSDVDVELFVCLNRGELACGAIFTLCDGIAQYHLSGTSAPFLKNAPTKLVIDEARKWAQERGARVLHLGGGAGSAEDSLFRFKSGFSKQRHEFVTWRFIVEEDEYADLIRQRAQFLAEDERGLLSSPFFPAYREPREE